MPHIGLAGDFDPDQSGFALAHCGLHRGEIAHLDELDLQTPFGRVSHQPVAQAPVHHLRRHDVIAGLQRQEHARCRRHARTNRASRPHRLRARQAPLRADRRPDCRRGCNRGRNGTGCPDRGYRSTTHAAAARRRVSLRRSSPDPAPRLSQASGRPSFLLNGNLPALAAHLPYVSFKRRACCTREGGDNADQQLSEGNGDEHG